MDNTIWNSSTVHTIAFLKIHKRRSCLAVTTAAKKHGLENKINLDGILEIPGKAAMAGFADVQEQGHYCLLSKTIVSKDCRVPNDDSSREYTHVIAIDGNF